MRITITGGSGFLGSHVADELTKKGHKVIIFDKKKSKWLKVGQKMVVGSILNLKELENVIKKSDVIYHFAALSDLNEALKEPIDSVNFNVLGTVNALELARKHKIKRFIHASTIYVNSSEGGFYRCSKKAAEDYVEEYKNFFDLDYTILRFGSLYGERSDNTNGITETINKTIINGEIRYAGSKDYVRKYIHVTDAAKACVEILKKNYKNSHINITGNKKIKVHNFLKILAKILNISKKIKFLNKKYTGHYVATPFTYQPKKGKEFTFKSNASFKEGLQKLVKSIKKN